MTRDSSAMLICAFLVSFVIGAIVVGAVLL